jgi:hypothetical protein
MKTTVAALACLLLSLSVAAQDRPQLVQPKGSLLKAKKIEIAEGPSAEFDGQVWVKGTLVAIWPAGAKNTAYKAPDYVLVLDAASTKLLPYFIVKDPPHVLRYRIRTIDIQNGAEAMEMSAGLLKARKITDRMLDVLKVEGSFLVDRLVVGAECDAPWAHGVVVKADVPATGALATAKIPERC